MRISASFCSLFEASRLLMWKGSILRREDDWASLEEGYDIAPNVQFSYSATRIEKGQREWWGLHLMVARTKLAPLA